TLCSCYRRDRTTPEHTLAGARSSCHWDAFGDFHWTGDRRKFRKYATTEVYDRGRYREYRRTAGEFRSGWRRSRRGSWPVPYPHRRGNFALSRPTICYATGWRNESKG